jgi:hypothetical protein
MKYLIVALLGLVVGSAAAGAVLYYNPFSVTATGVANPSDRVLHYSLPDDVLAFSFGNDARYFGTDPGDDGLWEETIDRTAVLGLVLNDDDNQPAAVASRLMAVSPDSNLLMRGVVVSDYWLVTFPGQGTLFVRADTNAWRFLKEALVPVWFLDRPWNGPSEYWPTVGPGTDDNGVVVGLSGDFRGSEGSVVERYELTTLDPQRQSALAEGELRLNLDLSGPQVAVQQ